MNPKLKSILEDVWWNIGIVCTSIFVFTVFAMSAPDLDRAGLGGLANLLFPGLIGVFTIIIYFLTRIFANEWNWIITLAGVVFMAYVSTMLFFDRF